MKKIKSIVVMILIGILMLSLAGCGGGGSSDSPSTPENNQPEDELLTADNNAGGDGSSGSQSAQESNRSEDKWLTADNIAKYAEEQGALAYEDPGEILNRFIYDKHNSGVEQIDGRIILSDESLKDFFESGETYNAVGVTMEFDPAMTKAAYYFVDGYLDFGTWFFETVAVDFNSPDAAASYGEKMQEELKTTFEAYPDTVDKGVFEGTEDNIDRLTAVGEQGRTTLHQSIYIDGSSVMIIVMRQNNSDLGGTAQTAFCEHFSIYDPTNDQKTVEAGKEPEPEPKVQEYTGNTEAYIINTYNNNETTADGYEIIVYADPEPDPEWPDFVDYEAVDLYRPSVMYIYLDGVEVKQDEIDDRTWGYRGRLYLTEPEQVTEGVHTMEFIQYVDDDPAGEQRFYQSAEFKIVYDTETDND